MLYEKRFSQLPAVFNVETPCMGCWNSGVLELLSYKSHLIFVVDSFVGGRFDEARRELHFIRKSSCPYWIVKINDDHY